MTRFPLPTPNFLFLALAFAPAASCSLEMPGAAYGERVLVSIYASGLVRSGSDRTISDLQVLAFADGHLDVCESIIGNSASVSLLKDRMLHYYVVANAPLDAFSDVKTESQFLSTKCRLEDNSEGSFVMEGSGSGIFRSDETVDVDVTRAVSRIELESIEPALFAEASYASAGVRITGAFLLNVCASVPYSLVPTEGNWLNRGTVDSTLVNSNVGSLLFKRINRTLSDASIFETDVRLYACPNPVGDTRLVVEAEIGGVANYYPIRLPRMESNHTYVVRKLVINGFGSPDPGEDVVRENISFEVEVRGWEENNIDANF